MATSINDQKAESSLVDEEKTSTPPPAKDETELEYPPFRKVVFIMIALYLSMFIVALDRTIIGTAIPSSTLNPTISRKQSLLTSLLKSRMTSIPSRILDGTEVRIFLLLQHFSLCMVVYTHFIRRNGFCSRPSVSSRLGYVYSIRTHW